MKILHVFDITKFGGIQSLVKQLTDFQSIEQNMKVTILSPFKPDENYKYNWNPKINVVFGYLNSGIDCRLSKLFKIIQIFRENDLIHFHGFNVILIFCAQIAKTKIVYTEHGTFQKANQKISLRKYINKKYLGYFCLKHFVAKVVFNSNWLKSNVALRSNNVTVILNGTSEINHGYRKLNSSSRFNVLTIARFVYRKRIDRLVSAFSQIINIKEYFLHLVGSGPLLQELKAQAKKQLPEGSYKFYGYQSDVTHFYRVADLFVLPTNYEPFGLVVLEAMFAKIPVICFFDGGGALEIINDVHPRLIVRDESDLSEAIEYWRLNKEERKKIGEALYRRAVSYFTIDRMAAEYLNVYNEVLGKQFH